MELPTSITDYLDDLTDVQQDRLLVGTLIPGGALNYTPGDPGCLMQVAEEHWSAVWHRTDRHEGLWTVFDNLCWNDDDSSNLPAVGAAIRDYICERRATRELPSAPLEAVAV